MSLQSVNRTVRRPVGVPSRPGAGRSGSDRGRPRAASSTATVLVEVAVVGAEALQTATRLAGEIRDLVDSAGAESASAQVSASVGLQLGAGRPALTFSQPGVATAPRTRIAPVSLPAFVAPGSTPPADPEEPISKEAGPIGARAGATVAEKPVRPATPVPDTVTLRIYPARRVALLAGVALSLTRREFDLLLFLSEHAGRVFDRPQLLRLVWGHQVICGERTVDVHVRRLRAKVERSGPVIATVRGVGYRLDSADRVAVLHEG